MFEVICISPEIVYKRTPIMSVSAFPVLHQTPTQSCSTKDNGTLAVPCYHPLLQSRASHAPSFSPGFYRVLRLHKSLRIRTLLRSQPSRGHNQAWCEVMNKSCSSTFTHMMPVDSAQASSTIEQNLCSNVSNRNSTQ